MRPITARIPDQLDEKLSALAFETHHKKGELIRRALESYINNKSDILIALSRLERDEETISLEEVEKKYDLED